MPFELNKIYDYSESSLIEELQRVSKLTDKHLTQFEFRKTLDVPTSQLNLYGGIEKIKTIMNFGNKNLRIKATHFN